MIAFTILKEDWSWHTPPPRSHSHQDAKIAWCFRCSEKRPQWSRGEKLALRRWLRIREWYQKEGFGVSQHCRFRECWSNQQAWVGCQG